MMPDAAEAAVLEGRARGAAAVHTPKRYPGVPPPDGDARGEAIAQEKARKEKEAQERKSRDSMRVDRKHPGKKLEIKEQEKQNLRLLHAAAVKEDTEEVKRALQDGAQINAIIQKSGKRTALMAACLSGNAGSVRSVSTWIIRQCGCRGCRAPHDTRAL